MTVPASGTVALVVVVNLPTARLVGVVNLPTARLVAVVNLPTARLKDERVLVVWVRVIGPAG